MAKNKNIRDLFKAVRISGNGDCAITSVLYCMKETFGNDFVDKVLSKCELRIEDNIYKTELGMEVSDDLSDCIRKMIDDHKENVSELKMYGKKTWLHDEHLYIIGKILK